MKKEKAATPSDGVSQLFLLAAGLLILAVPFLRLLEAALRAFYMEEFYGSFREGLKKDVWFSEGWFDYVKTPLGMSMTLLPIICLIAAVILFFLAVGKKSDER